MQLLTQKQFKLQLLDTMEQVNYLERVAKENGYPHALIKLVRHTEHIPYGSKTDYYYVYDYDEYDQLGDDAEKIGDTQDNTDLFDYALSLNELKGSDFYHKVFADN